jgi:hypothetical protein
MRSHEWNLKKFLTVSVLVDHKKLGYLQVAIPIVPTIRVLVTFSKFEELVPKDVFATPPSSPNELLATENGANGDFTHSSGSWLSWIKNSANRVSKLSNLTPQCSNTTEDTADPFLIPADYTWTNVEVKKHKSKEKQPKRKGSKPVPECVGL